MTRILEILTKSKIISFYAAKAIKFIARKEARRVNDSLDETLVLALDKYIQSNGWTEEFEAELEKQSK